MARRFKIFSRARRNNQLILWGRKSGFKVKPEMLISRAYSIAYSSEPQFWKSRKNLIFQKNEFLTRFWTLCITVYRASQIFLKGPFWKFITFCENSTEVSHFFGVNTWVVLFDQSKGREWVIIDSSKSACLGNFHWKS